MITSYIIEGLDRLGKSTLIDGILQNQGFYQVLHYTKPQKLDFYDGNLQCYQRDNFNVMFNILRNVSNVILDRAHLGECVYAPMYRGYSGDYVFEDERFYRMDAEDTIRLILLVEDFSKSKHFIDDGLSLGTADKREAEQKLFIEAFNKSIFPNKKIICVTAADGSFRPKEDILMEAISD